jgi:sulfate adenylyltransferase
MSMRGTRKARVPEWPGLENGPLRGADGLITPYGGTLVDLLAAPASAAELRASSSEWPSWDLTPRQLCDLELLLTGAFSPLEGFLGRADHESVLATMRLASGVLWPMPVTLEVTEEVASRLGPGSKLALRDSEGVMLAVLHVEDVWQPDRMAEAEAVYGTRSLHHVGVARLMHRTYPRNVGGRVEGVQLPIHRDFRSLRLTPAEVRNAFARKGWDRIVAFHTRNPPHRAHYELTRRAAEEIGGNLLMHPVVGPTKPGDVDYVTRVRSVRALMPRYPEGQAMLAITPLTMRMAGPREAVWNAIIRRNYGCSHYIVGRHHASPGWDHDGTPFYGPYDQQDLMRLHEPEVGVEMVPFPDMVYAPSLDSYVDAENLPEGLETRSISGTELRRILARGEEIPEWFIYPEVAAELRKSFPPRSRQGFTVFFTGLSGSGKSTIAKTLHARLLEAGGRSVTLLDGDEVRKHLSSELGFSREHRDLNIRRIGWVAAEITKAGGIAICAPIAPYDQVRKDVRAMAGGRGGFVLVHVATPIEECERRDRKGLYAKARMGLVKEFTGISDPYEVPTDAEIVVDTREVTAEEAVDRIIAWLVAEGFLDAGAFDVPGSAG